MKLISKATYRSLKNPDDRFRIQYNVIIYSILYTFLDITDKTYQAVLPIDDNFPISFLEDLNQDLEGYGLTSFVEKENLIVHLLDK